MLKATKSGCCAQIGLLLGHLFVTAFASSSCLTTYLLYHSVTIRNCGPWEWIFQGTLYAVAWKGCCGRGANNNQTSAPRTCSSVSVAFTLLLIFLLSCSSYLSPRCQSWTGRSLPPGRGGGRGIGLLGISLLEKCIAYSKHSRNNGSCWLYSEFSCVLWLYDFGRQRVRYLGFYSSL